MPAPVRLVPLVDVTWANFAPLSPERDFIADPPPLDLCAREVEACIALMRELSGGKAAYAIHSGIYNRRGFYEPPFLALFRRAVADGAELCVHTHEEIARKGTLNRDAPRMIGIIRDRIADLAAAGLSATSYRGGHFAYLDYLTPVLEEAGLLVDLSSAPGFHREDWDACWGRAPLSAHYIRRGDPAALEGTPSRVLEIPLGADGQGDRVENLLYVEVGEDGRLERIWDRVMARAAEGGAPQTVHVLFHTSSLSMPVYLERFRRFMDHVARSGASFATPTEAKAAFDAAA